MNCYPFVEAEKQGDHNVKRACELLQVSRSAYYADRVGGPSLHEQRDAELTGKIIEIHDDSSQTHGSPRVHHELLDQRERCSRKRVVRLMQASGRRGRVPRGWKKTTIPGPGRRATPRSDRPRLRRRPRPAGRAGYPLVRRHHLRPHLARLALPGHRDRPRVAPGGRLGGCGPSAHRPGRRGTHRRGESAPARARSDIPLR